ncbi:MAG: hypothetical protein Unbinned2716contig1004_37 [Prokaryotic dsDNA virus sp.]|nr:MAG: hypothetical protein Unbinned2716contig1004_37 [Prokaryotic dsDNA virus sp.]|tara:strand:- start:3260 stop:3706 length:447 start_codon:yes stop_codon:yes gene_type:complete
MAVTYSNNFNNIIDKLMEIIKVEVPVPVVKATTKDPMLKANQSIRIIPNGSTLVTYASHMEQREYSMTIQYIFLDKREDRNFLDHVMANTSQLEALIHDNITMTLSDTNSTRAFDLRMDEMELDADVDEEGYFVVEYSFSCQHIGNQA